MREQTKAWNCINCTSRFRLCLCVCVCVYVYICITTIYKYKTRARDYWFEYEAKLVKDGKLRILPDLQMHRIMTLYTIPHCYVYYYYYYYYYAFVLGECSAGRLGYFHARGMIFNGFQFWDHFSIYFVLILEF